MKKNNIQIESSLGNWEIYRKDEIKEHTDFLESLVKEFSEAIHGYYEAVGELPFIRKERVTSTYITIALSKISPAIANELYFKTKSESKTRYLDTWFYDSDKEKQYFIELKQINKSLKTQKFTEDFKEKIAKCFEQTMDLDKQSIDDEFDNVSDNDKFYRMSLIVAFSWKGFSDNEEFKNFKTKNSDTIFEEVNEELKTKLNYFVICKIKEKLLEEPLKVSDNQWQIFPHIFLFGKIEEIC